MEKIVGRIMMVILVLSIGGSIHSISRLYTFSQKCNEMGGVYLENACFSKESIIKVR